MDRIYLTVLFLILSSPLFAHSNEDPVKDLAKTRARLTMSQLSFESLENRSEQYESLVKQAGYLQANIHILRNLMAKDYPHVKESMSKYKLDYIAEVDKNLKSFRETLEQMKETMDE